MSKTRQILGNSLKTSKLIIVAIFLFNTLASLTSIIQPLAFQKLFDEVLPNEEMNDAIILIIIIVLIPVIFVLFNSITAYFNNKLGNRLAQRLRIETFNHILDSQLSKISKIGKGELINRLTSQIGQLCNIFLVDTLMMLVSNVILLIFTVGIMLSMSVTLTLVSFISFPLLMLIMRRFRARTHQLDQTYFSVLDRGLNYLNDFFTNIKTVHIHNGQEHERKNWLKWNRDVTQINTKSQVFHHTLLNLMSDIIISVVTGLIYGYSLYLIFTKQITVGTLFAFIIILPRLYNIFQALFTANIDIERMKVIEKNINDVFALDKLVDGHKTITTDVVPEIKFNQLTFNYEKEEWTGINDLNLTIEPGSFVGIVGISGSGKSTLFELLHRHIEPDMGEILLDTTPIQTFDIASLRELISYTPQSSVLWNKSILENIIYPLDKTEMTDELWEKFNDATKTTNVDAFVQNLPDQYESIVENNGENFSGGEIQRMMLARSFMKDAKIILLDEFTSALDAITEHELNQTLLNFREEKTIMIVAHRLSTIKHADKVIVVEQGGIKEVGSIPELLELKGRFYQLYTHQQL